MGAAAFSEPGDERPVKRVLMFVSYHMTHAWTRQLASGIQNDTGGLSYRLDYNIVELDALRSRDRNAWEKKIQSYLPALREKYYDMVVVVDDDAVQLFLEHYAELPKDLPIIFAGYENYTKEFQKKYPNVTGTVQNFDVADSVRVGLKLFPETRNVVILVDSTPSGRRFESILRESLPSFKDVNVIYLSDSGRSPAEMLAEIRKLPRDSLFVLTPWRGLYHSEDHPQTPTSFGVDLVRAAGRPFLVCEDSLFGSGALGGFMVTAEDQAKEAASVIRRIFDSGNVKNVPVVQSVPRPLFDYKLLEEKGLRPKALPPETVFVNEPPPIWKVYRKWVLLSGGGFLLVIAGILGYVYVSRRTLYRSLSLLKALPGRVGVCTRKERILFLHADDADLLGYRIKYICDVPHIDYEKISRAIATVFETRKPLTIDYEYKSCKRAMAIAPLDRNVFGVETIVWFSHDNTELQKSRYIAEEAAERFSQTLLCIGDAVIATDCDGRITILNAVAEKLIGYAQAEAVGRPHGEVFRIVDGRDGSPLVSPLSEALASGTSVKAAENIDLLSRAGTRSHISESAAPIKNSQGKVIGAILVFRDMTEEYEKRDRLRSSTLAFEYASELTRSAYFRLNPQNRKIEGSKLLPELCPIENGCFLPEERWVFQPDLEKVLHSVTRLTSGKEETVTTDFRSTYFGGMRYCRLKMTRDRNAAGDLSLIGVIQDITEITDTLQKAQDLLPLWDLVMYSIPVMFFIKNAQDDFRYIMVNTEFANLIGRPAEDIIGRTDAEIIPMKNDADGFHAKDVAVMKKGGIDDSVEFMTDISGNAHWFRTIKKPFVGVHKEPMLMGLSIDITELHNLVDSERIINRALTQISLESHFKSNVKQIFATLSDQVNCDYIMLSVRNLETGKYRLYDEWDPEELFSGGKALPDNFFDAIDSEFVNAGLVKVSYVETSPWVSMFEKQGTKSFIAVPVFVENRLWGGLVVAFCSKARAFSNVDENIMRSMSNIIALAQIREYQLQAIQTADREKQLILNNIRIPIWLYDKNGEELRINTAASRITGRAEFDEISFGAGANIFSETADLLGEHSVLRVIETGQSSREEAGYQGRDYIVTAEPVFDDSNELIYIVRSAVDVTDLNASIRNEKIVNTCLETLFGEENMEEALNTVLKEICIHQNADRCYIIQHHLREENPTVSLMAEYLRNEVPSRNYPAPLPLDKGDGWYKRLLRHEFLVYPDLNDEVAREEMKIFLPYLDQHNIRSLFSAGIYLNDRLWGNFGLVYEKVPHYFSEMNFNFLQAAAHLIELLFQRKAVQEQLLAALREAQSADKAKSYFIASVSHEIRTPLNAVIGFSELLRDEELDRKTQKDYLDAIAYSGNALLQLINDVLDLSKLEAGQMTILPTVSDIRELCMEVMKVFHHRALDKNLEMTLEPGSVPMLLVDRLRIRQILFNLIGNAVKFTKKGKITITAEFSFTSEESGDLRIGVRDTGIGISQEDCKNLASPFVQLSGMRGTHAANNGTGLGLAISKRMAEAMNGDLFIESELGKGSYFYVTMHNVKVKAAPQKETALQEEPAVSPGALSVLVVDDVEMNLKVLQAMLIKIGVKEVERANSGKDALALLRSRRFDIVLTDIWMPEMNGAELVAEIRKDPSMKSIPLIALTADEEADFNFPMKDFSGVLLKPVTLDKLKKALCLAMNENKSEDSSGSAAPGSGAS